MSIEERQLQETDIKQRPLFSITEVSNVSPEKVAEIEKVYEQAYGDNWIGHQTFTSITIPSTTQIATLELNGKIVAAGNMSGKRISLLGTNPEFQGQGTLKKLIEGIAATVDGAWISIGVDSNAVLNVLTSANLPFQPVDDPQTIVRLFQANNANLKAENFRFTKIFQPSLSALLTRRGTRQEVFTASSRDNAIHRNSYQQVIFQSRGKM